MSHTADLFVELLVEEIPASMVRPALEGLRKGILGAIKGLDHGEVRTWATPRRFAVAISGVQAARPVQEKLITGGPAERAFVDGQPSKMAIGFAKSKGVDVSALEVVEVPKRGKVVAVRVRQGGERAIDLVCEAMSSIIESIPFKKSMRWGAGTLTFGRPLHRVTITWDGEPVGGEAWGITFGAETLGHRLSPGPISVTTADQWVEDLRAHHVEPDLDRRKQIIAAQLVQAAERLGADPIVDDSLLEEVTHLVEWPVLVVGTFDEDLLNLPARLLVTSMRVHQRYFPVFDGGKLTNRFVIISNNPFGDDALIADGNARVLRARFYDARFFFAEDQQKTLVEHGAGLSRMQWIRGLGSMADKAARVGELAGQLAADFGAGADLARRAGLLSKADLLTQMVGEFPELQGYMGKLYAQHDHEPDAVAQAIEEHYLPRFAGDDVATTAEGLSVAVAERVDSLVGTFGVGMKPKGGGDPYGLRRAAVGVVASLVSHGARKSLRKLYAQGIQAFHTAALAGPEAHAGWLKAQGDGLEAKNAAALADELVEFTLARFKAAMVADGASSDLVDAIFAADGAGDDVVMLSSKLDALRAVAGGADFLPIMHTFKRVLKITGASTEPVPSPDQMTEQVERDLHEAVVRAEQAVSSRAEALDYEGVLAEVLRLREPVEAFFDGVMVNADDPAVRSVRLGLLGRIGRLFSGVADFSRITTR